MEPEEKDKLLAYTIKMIERGDRFADIILYLDRKGADSELKKEIISKLEEHKKMLESKTDEKKLYPVSMSKIVFGLLFSVLTLYLWYMNIITFPVTLLGIIVAIATLFEMTKSILNLFKNKRS
ncbi:MAG: hypothetical protein LBK97_06635 [Prevotellaceae bacterium]|jgi:hypothetical protein|nr:hypothetical protein [Prevotellaceae bacterium]